VDLGEGKHVIALLAMGSVGRTDPEFRTIVPGALGVRWDDPDELFAALASSAKSRIVADVPPRLLPTLVTFRALGDPSTARVVPANVSE
ncbi:hypothetical protein, partial [Klebsiella pneumoniae]|uniref:hypothetical protein n=1 Tax=Klebsiella pneumoniae TaxID=573 RepID=UPI001953AA1F